MKGVRIVSLLFLLFVFVPFSQSQDYTVNFSTGARQFEENVKEFDVKKLAEDDVWNNRIYRYIQFYQIPTEAEIRQIESHGIELLEYLPNFTYLASLPSSIKAQQLQALNVRSVQGVEEKYKLGKRLVQQDYPDWAVTKFGTLLLLVSFQDDVDFTEITRFLLDEGMILHKSFAHVNMAVLEVDPDIVNSLASKAYVKYIDVIPAPGEPDSDDGRNLHSANAIDGAYLGARDYDGTGVAISVNDDGFVGPHIDFKGRLYQDAVAVEFRGEHGDMVAGIAGGAGNLNPIMRGMAAGADMYIRKYDQYMDGTLQLHTEHNVLVFNTSMSGAICNEGYSSITRKVDQEMYENPTLLHVFSAGNKNYSDCGYGAGWNWGNITGGHKMGKNVITVANLKNDNTIFGSSSRGPANDGRIKPDISAHGHEQMSTDPYNGYSKGSGTSAAAPGITGVIAQLHQAYRELNGGQTANSALLKATVLNTANDLGNVGPDFIFGFGKVNALKAVKLLEDGRYLNDSLSQGLENTHTITIPAGVEEVKVMVYWTDKETAQISSTSALVNDLDAVLLDPSSGSHLPWVLDHTPNATNLADPATKGADHLNNVEQISITNPSAGDYDLKVAGTTVPFGPQEYFVVYEFITSDITVTYPMGGEGLIPGSTDRIHWDAYGNTGPFTIEYTTDNGATWTTISNSTNGVKRVINWAVPNTQSGQVRVRVSRGGVTGESTGNFSIMARPQNIQVDRVCPTLNTIRLIWNPVPGATGYDIFMLGDKSMEVVGSSVTNQYDVIVSDVSEEQWFTVRATGPNGMRSNRQIAINFSGNGNGANCYLACASDNDAGVSSLNQPIAIFNTCSGNLSTDVEIDLENIGLFTESNIPVYYQLDDGPIVSETYNGSLAPGANQTYTFSSAITFPNFGSYTLKTWTGLPGDLTLCNDTITRVIKVVSPFGPPPMEEDFDGNIFPSSNFDIINSNNNLNLKWSDRNLSGPNGNQTVAAYMNNFFYDGLDQEDIIEFRNVDLSNVPNTTGVLLSFDLSYVEFEEWLSQETFTDALRIEVSNDCGLTFSEVFFKDGSDLSTSEPLRFEWVPGRVSDWKQENVDLSSYIGGNLIVRFVNTNGLGNNLYIDNVNIAVDENAFVNEMGMLGLSILPNPAHNETTVQFDQPLTNETGLSIYSMEGKLMYQQSLVKGTTAHTIDVSRLESAIYIVRFQSPDGTVVRKIVVR